MKQTRLRIRIFALALALVGLVAVFEASAATQGTAMGSTKSGKGMSLQALAGGEAPLRKGNGYQLQVYAEQMDKVGKDFIAPGTEGDLMYLGASLEKTGSSGVKGETLQINVSSGIQLVQTKGKTDEAGYVNFIVLAKTEGDHVVTVSARGLTVPLTIRVLAPMSQAQFKKLGITNIPSEQGVLSWRTLMQADLKFGTGSVAASFSPAVKQLDGKEVKLMGFMVPLDADDTQKHFLLSASPPFCYFHMPGGPTTVAEVFATKGIKYSDDPIVLSGKLKTLSQSGMGVLYQMQDAREFRN